MKSIERACGKAIAILLCAALAGCGNANKFVLFHGTVLPPLRNCAASVATPSQVYDTREVQGKFMLRYLAASSDPWIDIDIRCDGVSVFKHRYEPIIDKMDVGDVASAKTN